ncbi:MAG: OB-fold nucleic acid binding domain-containing protein, partial [Lentisphaeria bacterium]|nr:OB-fold nucleic acid binding domain-containing protein [Lentisphaeria bacterium]
MKHSLITEVFTNHTIGEILTVKGWVRTRRDSKGGFSFIELNDGSSNQSLQLVVDNTLSNYDADVLQLQPGASISATGQLVSSAGTKQTKELKVTKLCVYGHVDINEYPLQKKRISFEKLREIAHLRPRTNTFSAMTRVRNQLAVSTHNFFQEKHFYYLNTPIITANDCEGAGEMFNISTLNPENPPRRKDGKIDWSRDFFARQANLTVSGQLAAETHACALGRVYTFGPTFRAENSNTSRHLAEFWMVEPEIAFADLE